MERSVRFYAIAITHESLQRRTAEVDVGGFACPGGDKPEPALRGYRRFQGSGVGDDERRHLVAVKIDRMGHRYDPVGATIVVGQRQRVLSLKNDDRLAGALVRF